MSCETSDMIEHVIGASVNWPCTYTEDGVTPINLSGYAIAAYVRTQDGVLVAQLVATITAAAAGEFALTLANTSAWPEGTHRADIRYTSGADVSYTQKAMVRCTRPETEARTGD